MPMNSPTMLLKLAGIRKDSSRGIRFCVELLIDETEETRESLSWRCGYAHTYNRAESQPSG